MANKKMFLFTVLFLVSIGGIGVDIYAASLPYIASALVASKMLVKLTIVIYILGNGFSQIIAGTLSDSYGRRKLLIGGLIINILASLFAAFSYNIGLLLICRFSQGIGIGISAVIVRSMVTDSFVGDEIKKVSTYLTMAWGIGPIIAPFIGGHLQYYFGWQSNFYFLCFYALFALILVIKFVPETIKNKKPLSLSAVINVYGEIFSNRVFIGSVLCLIMCYAFIITYNVMAPFIIQNILSYNSIIYGNTALCVSLAYFLGNLTNRFLINRFKIKNIIALGIGLSLTSSIIMLLILLKLFNLATITLPVLFIFFGSGLLFPNFMYKCLSLFPFTAGSASSVFGGLIMLGGFVVGFFISVIKLSSPFPFAISYIILSIIILLIFLLLIKNNLKNSESA
jgi:MFS transporter, DHA1 family, multidrug resistance protein